MAGTFSLDISKWVEKANGRVDLAIKKVCFDLGEHIVIKSPVDTGRFRASWRFSPGNADGSVEESGPGTGMSKKEREAGRKLIGGISGVTAMTTLDKGQAAFDPLKHESFFITNSLPYAVRLEEGHSEQAPHGIVRLTVQEFTDVVAEAVNGVK